MESRSNKNEEKEPSIIKFKIIASSRVVREGFTLCGLTTDDELTKNPCFKPIKTGRDLLSDVNWSLDYLTCVKMQ